MGWEQTLWGSRLDTPLTNLGLGIQGNFRDQHLCWFHPSPKGKGPFEKKCAFQKAPALSGKTMSWIFLPPGIRKAGSGIQSGRVWSSAISRVGLDTPPCAA